jgi:HK97 gp10 family phage protein
MQMTGARELVAALSAAPERMNAYAAGAVAASTVSVAQRMRSLVPRDTGTLQRSIGSSASGLNGRVTIGADAYYWRFVEFGTTRGRSTLGGRFTTAAQPFVRPSAEEETPVFERRMNDVVDRLARDFSVSRFV